MTPWQKFVEAMRVWARHGDRMDGCEYCDAIRAACEAFADVRCQRIDASPRLIFHHAHEECIAAILKEVFDE